PAFGSPPGARLTSPASRLAGPGPTGGCMRFSLSMTLLFLAGAAVGTGACGPNVILDGGSASTGTGAPTGNGGAGFGGTSVNGTTAPGVGGGGFAATSTVAVGTGGGFSGTTTVAV